MSKSRAAQGHRAVVEQRPVGPGRAVGHADAARVHHQPAVDEADERHVRVAAHDRADLRRQRRRKRRPTAADGCRPARTSSSSRGLPWQKSTAPKPGDVELDRVRQRRAAARARSGRVASWAAA